MITLFKSKGMPRCIRVDNGLPLGSPNRDIIPVLSLWLILLGVKIIWNRPRQPRDNAKVERAQRTLRDWAEPSRWHTPKQLQGAIDHAIEMYNQHYQVRRLGDRTRAQVYPKLLIHTGNRYQKRKANFSLVLESLAKRTWKRKVASSGQVYIFNHRFMVGKSFAKQYLSIQIDPKNNQWKCFDQNSKLVKTQPTNLSMKQVQMLIPFKDS
ncbi:MAG: integrase core domain-containing protein [Bacteroidia bacterium]